MNCEMCAHPMPLGIREQFHPNTIIMSEEELGMSSREPSKSQSESEEKWVTEGI